MFLTFLNDYYDFFIIFIGIVIGMIAAYIIFFKPNNRHKKKHNKKHRSHHEPKKDIIEKETTDKGYLSFDEEDPDDDFFYDESKEFTLGENSNILESLYVSKDENDTQPENYQVDDDHLLKTRINPEDGFSQDDEESKALENNKRTSNYEGIDSLDIESKDPEVQLNKIVREVIPANDYENQNIGKYHVLFRKDDERWYVKREGKEEIDKFLETKKEAIAYATIQALIYATTIVVHEEDGKIAKYDF